MYSERNGRSWNEDESRPDEPWGRRKMSITLGALGCRTPGPRRAQAYTRDVLMSGKRNDGVIGIAMDPDPGRSIDVLSRVVSKLVGQYEERIVLIQVGAALDAHAIAMPPGLALQPGTVRIWNSDLGPHSHPWDHPAFPIEASDDDFPAGFHKFLGDRVYRIGVWGDLESQVAVGDVVWGKVLNEGRTRVEVLHWAFGKLTSPAPGKGAWIPVRIAELPSRTGRFVLESAADERSQTKALQHDGLAFGPLTELGL